MSPPANIRPAARPSTPIPAPTPAPLRRSGRSSKAPERYVPAAFPTKQAFQPRSWVPKLRTAPRSRKSRSAAPPPLPAQPSVLTAAKPKGVSRRHLNRPPRSRKGPARVPLFAPSPRGTSEAEVALTPLLVASPVASPIAAEASGSDFVVVVPAPRSPIGALISVVEDALLSSPLSSVSSVEDSTFGTLFPSKTASFAVVVTPPAAATVASSPGASRPPPSAIISPIHTSSHIPDVSISPFVSPEASSPTPASPRSTPSISASSSPPNASPATSPSSSQHHTSVFAISIPSREPSPEPTTEPAAEHADSEHYINHAAARAARIASEGRRRRDGGPPGFYNARLVYNLVEQLTAATALFRLDESVDANGNPAARIFQGNGEGVSQIVVYIHDGDTTVDVFLGRPKEVTVTFGRVGWELVMLGAVAVADEYIEDEDEMDLED